MSEDETIEELESHIDVLYNNRATKKHNKRRDSKRARKEGDSIDTEDSVLLGIHESMESMQEQLKKLDLLTKLTKDVDDLKQSVEFNNSLT